MLCADAVDSDSGADDDGDGYDELRNTDSSRDTEATVDTEDTEHINDDCCEVCLLVPREQRIALVPRGHQRFCASCATEVHNQRRGCPSAVLTFRWFFAFSETVTLIRCLN